MTRSLTSRLTLAAVAAILVVGIVGVGYALTQQTLPSDAGGACVNGVDALSATEFNGWFDSGAVSLNGSVKPADSVNFLNRPNCTFYKWSEQMFLWLTSPAPTRYHSDGLVMNSPAFYDVSLPVSGQRHFVPHSDDMIRAFNVREAQLGTLDLPVAIEKTTLRLLEILPPVLSPEGRQLVADKDGKEVEIGGVRFTEDDPTTPILLDVSGKEIASPRALLSPEIEKRIEELGNFDKSELVQKIVVDDSTTALLDLSGHFTETEQGQANGGVLMAQNGSLVYYAITVNNVFALYRTMQGASVPAGTQFPVSQSDLDAITTFAAAHGQPTVIDSEALAIEIKTSWVEAASLTDASKFIQMRATVPSYDTSDPDDWVPNGTRTVMLAMVGMHVVGSTRGHPEMLWATFEHLSNGPAADYSYTKAPSGTGTVLQDTTGDWLFCSNGASVSTIQMHMKMGDPNTSAAGHIVSVSPFQISPTNVVRTMPWGLNGTSSSGGNAEVISLNNTVRSLLDPADVRRNYFHVGTTWTISGASPNGANQVGTNKLANTTMETFTQGGNCFDCHTTNTTAVSRVFGSTSPLF